MYTLGNETHQSFVTWFIEANCRHSFLMMHLLLFLHAANVVLGSFSKAAIIASGLWLLYRAYCVLRTPLDELVSHLGHDIPSGPRLDLASVKADAVTLHWKPAEDRKSTNRFEVHVNGVSAGQIAPSDTSFVISNLAPDHVYIFRIVVFNNPEFKASSPAIRIRTKPASSGDYYQNVPISGSIEHKETSGLQSGPIIKPFKALPDTLTSPVSAPAMTRETSNGPLSTKRAIQIRRPSPVMHIPESQASHGEDLIFSPGLEATQKQLTERLEEIGREITETEKQILEEEQEAATGKIDLAKERDELRASLREKENLSKDLRKQVSALERENAAAQGRRTAQDRQVQQRRLELQKVRDDTERWAKETKEMRAYVKECKAEKTRIAAENDRIKRTLQAKVSEEAKALKNLEDEVKERSVQVKQLERGKTNSPASGEHSEHYDHLYEQEVEEDRLYDERIFQLEQDYKSAVQDFEMAKRLCQEASIQLLAFQERSRQLAYYAGPGPAQQPISRHNSTRQRRGPSDQFMTAALPVSRYPIASDASFSNNIAIAGPADPFGPHVTPFFNMSNGMALDVNTDNLGLNPLDIERLTGGAPMSPSAGADLLPADLLSAADEEPPTRLLSGSAPPPAELIHRSGSTEAPLPGLGAFGSANMLPGLGVSGVSTTEGPASPGSVSSRSPSIFASPQASASNLAFHSPEQPLDSDGRSIRSGRSIRPASGGTGPAGSRFAQILGLSSFNRQRGKTVADDSLALGRLQSQSMPKDAAQDDPQSSSKRRNSSNYGNFFGNLRTGFGTNKNAEDDVQELDKAAASRRKPFMGLGGKDGWGSNLGAENRPVLSRPSSTHSSERPRQTNSGSSWAFWQSGDAFGGRNAPVGPDWNQQQPPSGLNHHHSWGSRFPSRRGSGQFGSGSGMAFGIQESDDSDGDDLIRPPPLAPIGTRPIAPIERPITPKLNPAAQDFKSLFSFNEGKKDKSEKKDKSKGQEDLSLMTPSADAHSPMLLAQEDMSPPQSRKSRDSRSVLTAESSNNEVSSNHSLDQTPSHTPSEVPTSASLTSSTGKGSFMRKLSRKSSGGKFGLPVFQLQREKKSKNAEKTVSEETEEDSTDNPESASRESLPKTPSGTEKDDKRPERNTGRSWSAVFTGKIGKGKKDSKEPSSAVDKEQTPSVSEASTTDASDAAVDFGDE
ncbi:hypothetical protein K461DRAFT_280632 [Myriangium duriaei CBS 260.36]|uniref:Fibronectin type-III domain-containing protein n=1 Tax=Myriangium duriaei CBS 260.36 TaxID=1168546 RepID=A0A9P4IZQ5_9PEZI|nr:hypothetical protein K461DRAFT_280632 [Myriangium duriaei CBS 260.36]